MNAKTASHGIHDIHGMHDSHGMRAVMEYMAATV